MGGTKWSEKVLNVGKTPDQNVTSSHHVPPPSPSQILSLVSLFEMLTVVFIIIWYLADEWKYINKSQGTARQTARSWRQLQDRLGRCPHQQGVRPIISSGRGADRVWWCWSGSAKIPMISRYVCSDGAALRHQPGKSSLEDSQDQQGAWPGRACLQNS